MQLVRVSTKHCLLGVQGRTRVAWSLAACPEVTHSAVCTKCKVAVNKTQLEI